ncbi:MAG: T9SS type A sorting domain-containing protein [Bacteroidota bacterium]
MRKILLLAFLFILGASRTQGQSCFVSANLLNTCATGCNYSASVVFQGPNMPFTVTVTGPNNYVFGPVIATSTVLISNMCPGTYQITVVDNQGNQCAQTLFTVPASIPLTVISQVVNASCSTCNDGAVVLSASGGTPPYVFNFNGINTSFVNNVAPGMYFASVTDANGCTDYDTVVVSVGSSSSYSLSGEIYLDVNTNGAKDPGEPGIGNQLATITPPGSNMISTMLGGYGTIVSPGTYDISYSPIPGWVLSSAPATYSVNVTSSSIGNLDFGVTPDSIFANGNLSLSSGLPRCFWTVPYYLNFYNSGFTPLTGSMSFNHDPLMTYSSSNITPASQSGNTVNYTFTNLYPGQSFSAIVYMVEPAAGNSLANYLTVNAGDPFGNQLAFTDTLLQTVSCSFDPNDKAVYPGGIGPLNYVSMDQRLEFLVRFQNTGNDTAFKVVILDTLDSKLDYSTFALLGNSHPVYTELDGNGKLTFTFDNILLPDSNVNEPASHGFVLYSIDGLSTNPDPTTVNNTAYIYFDQNAPVQTNTTLTTFSDNYLGIDEMLSDDILSIYPNPFNNEAVINCNQCQGDYLLQITDLVGKVVRNLWVNGSTWMLYKDFLSPGTYVVEVTSVKNGQAARMKFTVN